MPLPQDIQPFTAYPTVSDGAAPPQPDAVLSRIAAALEGLQSHAAALEAYRVGHEPQEISPKRLERMLKESPIASLLDDDGIDDVLINSFDEIYIGRKGVLERTNIVFESEQQLSKLAEAIAASVGRSINPDRPLVDARLADGSRVNIIAPPMAVSGLVMSIRKFPKQEITLDTLVEKGSITQPMADFLKTCAEQRVSMLISGGTGTGKTTMLNAISRYIPESERIITIEDTAELRLQQPHVVKLETKEPSRIGKRQEEVNASDLVRNALRMRPDRIIVGEVRGLEAFDMIQAMNTGHDGSMTTVHANGPREALTRIENLLGPMMQNSPVKSVRQQIVSAITIIVQLGYDADGTRRVTHISEVVRLEGDVPMLQDIFTALEQPVEGHTHQWTRIVPQHAKLAAATREQGVFPELRDPAVLNYIADMAQA